MSLSTRLFIFFFGLLLAAGGRAESDGLRSSTVGVYDPSTATFILKERNRNSPNEYYSVQYGPSNQGWKPVTGGFTQDGYESVGLFDPASSTFFLKNRPSSGNADITVRYGPPGSGWIPLIGNWLGNNRPGLGLYNPQDSTFHLRDSLSPGVADHTFAFGVGNRGWIPVVGDWDGNGTDTVGLYDPASSTFFLQNSLNGGNADIPFSFGPPGANWLPVAGDWNGSGHHSIGLYAPDSGTFFLRTKFEGGNADIVLTAVAAAGRVPIALKWLGDPKRKFGNIVSDSLIFYQDAAGPTRGGTSLVAGSNYPQWYDQSLSFSDAFVGLYPVWNGNGSVTDPFRLTFTNNGGGYALAALNPLLPTGSSQRTMAAWFRLTGPSNQSGTLITYGQIGIGQLSNLFYYGGATNGQTVVDDPLPQLCFDNYGGAACTRFSNDYGWHYFVALLPDGGTMHNVQLFLDGMPQNLYNPLSNQAGPAKIRPGGTSEINTPPNTGIKTGRCYEPPFDPYQFVGDIAVTSIYRRALTGGEILGNYQAQRARFGR